MEGKVLNGGKIRVGVSAGLRGMLCSSLSRISLLIWGYQAIAIFPLIVVIELNEPAYMYWLLLALSYGVGKAKGLASEPSPKLQKIS